MAPDNNEQLKIVPGTSLWSFFMWERPYFKTNCHITLPLTKRLPYNAGFQFTYVVQAYKSVIYRMM